MISSVSQMEVVQSDKPAVEKRKRTTITPFQKVLDHTTNDTKVDSAKLNTVSNSGSSITVPEKLESIFKKASEKYDVPYNFLVAVAKAESGFQVNATSKCGAQGIMQLMPATARSLGVKNAYDPEENIMGGAKYLAAQLKAFKGDTDLAAAAYNAGGAAVRKYGGIPPYEETKNYVQTINKYMNQGVSVPDKMVQVGTTPPTDATITVGSGENAMVMTYEAYELYRKLGTSGVG